RDPLPRKRPPRRRRAGPGGGPPRQRVPVAGRQAPRRPVPLRPLGQQALLRRLPPRRRLPGRGNRRPPRLTRLAAACRPPHFSHSSHLTRPESWSIVFCMRGTFGDSNLIPQGGSYPFSARTGRRSVRRII